MTSPPARCDSSPTARPLLTATTLPAADVAFASGFGTIRQFNDTIRAVYERSPLELRAVARVRERERRPVRADGGSSAVEAESLTTPITAAGAGVVRLRLPARPPFDAPGGFAWLATRALDGGEAASDARYERPLHLPGGP